MAQAKTPSLSECEYDIVIRRGDERIPLFGHFHKDQEVDQPIYHCVILFWSIYCDRMVPKKTRRMIHCYKPSDYRKVLQLVESKQDNGHRTLLTPKAFENIDKHQILIFPFGLEHVYALVVVIDAQNLIIPGEKMKYMVLSSDLEVIQDQGDMFIKYIKMFYEKSGYVTYPENIQKLVWLKPKVVVPNSGMYIMAMIELIYRQPNKFMRYATSPKPVHRYAELGMIIAQLQSPEASYASVHNGLRQFDIIQNPRGRMPLYPITILQGVFDDPPTDE